MCGLCSLTTRWVRSEKQIDRLTLMLALSSSYDAHENFVLTSLLGHVREYFHSIIFNPAFTDAFSGMGDSGALVVDATTGDLYGMIVAASTVMQEGYLIPATEITNDIQRAGGVSTVELPKKPTFTPALQYLKEFETFDRPFKAITDYINRLKLKYDRPGRTDYELRQPIAMQVSHLNVR